MSYEQQQQLVADVTAQMQICADMVGERDESKCGLYGFVPGLGEKDLANTLLTRIETIRNGIFQVMFTGCFSSGKSTLINALVKRDVLKTGATPETAVITKIFFNSDDEEKVVIYKRDQVDDGGQPVTEKIYDLKEFFDEYHVDEKDRERFLRTVDHVEMFLKTNGIAGSMVQFVDSPGTQASTADDKISLNFVKHADAIVFLVSAIAAMDQYDREYIAKRFANRRMKNIFFVVNRYNQLNTDEDRQKVKDRVHDELKEVFTDKHGNFDQKLYDKRVFYVNAFGSLNTRLGKETDLGFMKVMIPDESTGVPQFEHDLGEFLTSGDKDKVALSAYRPQMASIFVAAEKAAQGRRNALNRGIKENRDIITAYENDRDEIEAEIEAIRKAIEETEKNILRDAKDAYDMFLQDIDSKWDDYFADKKNFMQIGYWTLIRAYTTKALAFWRDPDVRKLECDETAKEATQGFADGIRAFIEERSDDLSRNVAFKIRNNIAQLMTDLSERQKHLEQLNMPINMDEIIEKIALEKNIPITGEKNQPKLGQAFVALFMADPELISLAGSGNAGTMDFIVQVIKVNIIDIVLGTILVAVIGNIFGLILFVAYKVIRYFFTNENLTDRLIAETKLTILDGYRGEGNRLVCDKDSGKPIFTGLRGDAKATYSNQVSATIHGIMRRTSGELVDGINTTLAEVENNLTKTNELLANDERALQRETVRLNNILNKIAGTISEISRLTDGTALDKDQIRALAVTAQ